MPACASTSTRCGDRGPPTIGRRARTWPRRRTMARPWEVARCGPRTCASSRRRPGRYLGAAGRRGRADGPQSGPLPEIAGAVPGRRRLRRAHGAGRRRARARALGELPRHRGLRGGPHPGHPLQRHGARLRRHAHPVADAGEDPEGELRRDLQRLERPAPGRARSGRPRPHRPQLPRHHRRSLRAGPGARRPASRGAVHDRLLRQPVSAQGLPAPAGGVPAAARARLDARLRHRGRRADAPRAAALHRSPSARRLRAPGRRPAAARGHPPLPPRPTSSSWPA